MGQMIRCPLVGASCMKPITIQEKTFFIAEAEKPEESRRRRIKAINEAIEDEYKIGSALDEKGINAFTCKICEMIQTCAYGIADITGENPNVLLELGMMIALGKPTVILVKKGEEQKLNLPSDLSAIEVIPFTEYIDIIDQLRQVVQKLPPPISPPSPIQDLEKIQPRFARELRKMRADIVKQFKQTVKDAKLDTISLTEEKKGIPPELDERIRSLEAKIEDMSRLGFTTDANTYFARGHYFYSQGKYEEAIANYSQYIEFVPNSDTAFNNRGTSYEKLGRYRDALADYSRSLELNSDDPLALNNRGSVYVRMQRYNDAFADFSRAQEIAPDYADSLYNLACVFSLWGKPVEALAYGKDSKYREIAKTDTDFANIRDDPRFKKLLKSG